MRVYECENEYEGQTGICSGLSALFCVNALNGIPETMPNHAAGAAIQTASVLAHHHAGPGAGGAAQLQAVLAGAHLQLTGRYYTQKGWVLLGFPPGIGTVWYVKGEGHAVAQALVNGFFYHYEPEVGLFKSNSKYEWMMEVTEMYDGLVVDLGSGPYNFLARDWVRCQVIRA
jgi:hypothetical protein